MKSKRGLFEINRIYIWIAVLFFLMSYFVLFGTEDLIIVNLFGFKRDISSLIYATLCGLIAFISCCFSPLIYGCINRIYDKGLFIENRIDTKFGYYLNFGLYSAMFFFVAKMTYFLSYFKINNLKEAPAGFLFVCLFYYSIFFLIIFLNVVLVKINEDNGEFFEYLLENHSYEFIRDMYLKWYQNSLFGFFFFIASLIIAIITSTKEDPIIKLNIYIILFILILIFSYVYLIGWRLTQLGSELDHRIKLHAATESKPNNQVIDPPDKAVTETKKK